MQALPSLERPYVTSCILPRISHPYSGSYQLKAAKWAGTTQASGNGPCLACDLLEGERGGIRAVPRRLTLVNNQDEQ